jgi:hypothetical protein
MILARGQEGANCLSARLYSIHHNGSGCDLAHISAGKVEMSDRELVLESTNNILDCLTQIPQPLAG